ncbi:MAG TPA: ABC transporter permease [Leptolyngbyaceae cyanobacterium M33_DOE_097]|uniref:ABC transporter permease n=1 Tax=Oscillatoriales cyanobacterium SpSt-418 TaxID=2282169 RepID=A0A7C3KII0_9CYAN|nr:ABC transporter permease [Leptolyngbyaceae cyanobacterium M33_DOE_097]
MKRILSQAVKELAQFRRDRLTLALALLLPLMTLLIFGFAIRLEAKDIPIVIQDFDNSQLSRLYTEKLFATNQFTPVNWQSAPETALDYNFAKAAVMIPPDFSQRVTGNQSSEVQVIVDGTDVNNARVIKNSIKATTQAFLQDQKLIPENRLVVPETRLWFNPGREESLYIVPGVYAVVLWIFPSLLAAIAMVREKERGTILQVYASDLTAGELILGKALAYLVVGLGMAIVIMGIGALIFRLRFAGDPMPLLIGTPLYLWASVMFGIMLGARTASQNAAVQGVALVGFLTALLLSGFIYPLSNIPFPLSLVSNVVPARYFIGITRDAYVRGIGWSGVWFNLLMIFGLGLILFNVARKALSRMQLGD